MADLKLISWNVNGIRAVEKKGFVEEMLSWDADVICLQETKAHKEQLSDNLLNIEGYKSWWHSGVKKGYSSTAIYSRLEPIAIHEGLGIEEFDNEGRVIIAEFEDFYIINCYFPNAQAEIKRIDYRLAFGDALIEQLNTRFADKTRLICGDYNVCHKPIDLARPKQNEGKPGYSMEERQWMDKLIGIGYHDTFRMFNQEPDQYSWWSYRGGARGRNVGWRLDYFCVDSASKDKIVDAGIMQEVMGSDHCPVSIILESVQKN
ncbi:MAG: exodeoxyribonuclease III [Lentisphaeraceae bacterium]|nr:exodeoxyribonuclease III [Lentisphaeraceae bacterium]